MRRILLLTGKAPGSLFCDAKEPLKQSRPENIRWFVAVCIACQIFGAFASAQNSVQQAPTKDPQAVAALNATLAAMGGQAAFGAIQDVTVSGQSQSSDQSAPADQFVWKSIGMSVRHEYSMPDGTHTSSVSQGKGQSKDPSGKISTIDSRASLTIFPYHMPGSVLLSLLNSADRSLSLVSDPTDDGNLIHLRSVQQLPQPLLGPITRQDWYIDPASGLPVRVSFYLPDLKSQRLDGTATIVFTNWQTAASIQVPQSMQLFYDGVLQDTITLGSPTFNQGLSASVFRLQ